jgi:hypothetical protein
MMSESVIRNLEIKTNQNRRFARAMTGVSGGCTKGLISTNCTIAKNVDAILRKQTIRLSPRRTTIKKYACSFRQQQAAGRNELLQYEVFFADL